MAARLNHERRNRAEIPAHTQMRGAGKFLSGSDKARILADAKSDLLRRGVEATNLGVRDVAEQLALMSFTTAEAWDFLAYRRGRK